MFVVFEGIDGSGKSTLSKMLASYLKKSSEKVLLSKYPSKGPVGSLIKKKFLYQDSTSEVDSFLFLADMFEQDNNVIKPLLKKKFHIVSDRYYPSFICYQRIQGFDTKLLSDFYNRLSKPDIVFFLKCDALTCYERNRKKKRSKYETLSFLRRVEKEYEKLGNYIKDKIIVLDSSKPLKEVFKKVLSEAGKLL
ncbi:MAG: dTMP kinase [Nanoarchaeota archaeon]|nr:dTMP kinase [Nanoarchaeota archaeon]